MRRLFRNVAAACSSIFGATPVVLAEPVAAGAYQIEPANCEVAFAIDNFWGAVTSRGTFAGCSGLLNLAEPFASSKVMVTIDVKSIDTGIGKRDEHLKEADFFDVATYPTATFQSTKVTGSPESFEIEGQLTIKATTKPVVLKGQIKGDQFSATGTLNRQDFSVSYSGMGLSDEVSLKLQVQPKSKG